jgi:hypothetical protein
MSSKPFLPTLSVGGELRAYGREVRAWSTGLLTRYAVAVALLLAAFAGLIGAIAVGLGALFPQGKTFAVLLGVVVMLDGWLLRHHLGFTMR